MSDRRLPLLRSPVITTVVAVLGCAGPTEGLQPRASLPHPLAALTPGEDEEGPWAPIPPAALPAIDPARGRVLYDAHCRSCHGQEGRGDGPVAFALVPRPRDLSVGSFKFRSTPSGSVASDADLFATVTVGLGRAMPGWSQLSEVDRWQLVYVVKSFSPRFRAEPARRVLALPPPSGGDAERGQTLYASLRCGQCHGEDGRGGAAPGLTDEQGRAVWSPNLRRAEAFRAGCSAQALQQTLFTGIDGTPMPSYEAALTPGDARDLVAFLRSLLARPDDCRR